MPKLIVNRVVAGGATLLLVAVVVFFLTDVLPGDICTAMLGRDAHGETLARCRDRYGTERPASERFVAWASGALRFDFGMTYRRDVPVAELIGPRFRNTALLGLAAAAIGIPLAIALGVVSALHRESRLDMAISSLSILAMTLPDFVTATLLVFIFSIALGWFPAIAIVNVDAPLHELLPNIVLPVIVLTFVMVAHILRMVRSSTIDVLSSPFVQAAQLRGVPERRVLFRHALPNALLPAINLIALTLAWLLGGTLIVETVFNYPGVGTLMVNAISDRDLPLVQAMALLLAALQIGLSLVADLIALVLNPRLRTIRG